MKVPLMPTYSVKPEDEQRRQDFKKWATGYLDSILPKGWAEVVQFAVYRDEATISVGSNFTHNLRAKTFCKFTYDKEFELTPKHIEKITEYIEEVRRLDRAVTDRHVQLRALEKLAKPVLTAYPSIRASVQLSGIRLRAEYDYEDVKTTIYRNGTMDEVEIPSTGKTTIPALRQHIETWESRAEELKLAAERIKHALPKEFFTEPKRGG